MLLAAVEATTMQMTTHPNTAYYVAWLGGVLFVIFGLIGAGACWGGAANTAGRTLFFVAVIAFTGLGLLIAFSSHAQPPMFK